MKEFNDRVAVITGAASGIGFGIAEHCIRKGINVVMADVEEQALVEAGEKIRSMGGRTVGVLTDVSKPEDVKRLSRSAIDAYGRVDLLFNNAGVAAGSSLWESTLNDVRWVIGVNLWGVIHCLREFIPIMIAQDSPCHIVNTSSLAGLTTYQPSAPYQLTKHAIAAMSEQLHHDLAIRGLKVKVSVLCPAFVNTRIMDAERNRPVELMNDQSQTRLNEGDDEMEKVFRQMIEQGLSAAETADLVFKAIVEEKFYILTHPEMNPLIRMRLDDLLNGRNPTFPMPG